MGDHTDEEYEILTSRVDVAENDPQERVENFVRTSRNIRANLNSLDEMAKPEASLHMLEEALIIQFPLPEGVIFVAMDTDVGRNFTRFVRDCEEQIRWGDSLANPVVCEGTTHHECAT